MARTHYLAHDAIHHLWDTTHAPKLTIESGDTVVIHTRDVSKNQIGPNSTADAIGALDPDLMDPLLGPIEVAGAEAGDTLAVEMLDVHPLEGWGWAAIIPGFGLLPEEFADPYLRIFDLTLGDVTYFRDDIAIPIEPFLGTMGVCPAGASRQPVMPPGTFGGNVDVRQLTAGSVLYLPVQVDGAMFSCGDGHAAQGDGEVCASGIECPMYVALRFTLEKGRKILAPQFKTSGALTPRVDGDGFYGTTGVGPDLYKASQDAVRAMIAHLQKGYDLSPEDAYLLCSLVVDLKISEIVDAGEYIVSALLPHAIFVDA